MNFSIGVLPSDIALFHALYRTSIKGRRDIISAMFSNDGLVDIDKSYTSRVSEIFNVTLKSLGIGLEFIDEEDSVKVLNDDIVSQHTLKGQTYFCTDYQFYLIERMDEIRDRILSENPILTEPLLQKMIEKEMKENKYINGPLNEELDGLELRVLEEISNEFIRQREEFEKANEEKVEEENSEDTSTE